MAVIKIVPMPGAEGQQGETGAVGPQGPQGDTGATGPAGADAVWYYNGEYNPGASYVVGDVVTYDGQLWYRKHANGGNVGDTPSEGFIWDLLAAKGAQGETGSAGSFNYEEGAVPPTHHGSVGDLKNDIRYDATHLYICVEDYTDGTAIIWKRINWASGNW